METQADDVKLLLNVRDVAQALGMSERTVWRLSAIGDIPPPIRIGRNVRWRRVTIEAWIEKKEARALRRCKASLPSIEGA